MSARGTDSDLDLERLDGPPSSLLDAVDKVIDKGAVLRGDVVLAIAGVDLVNLRLDLLLAATETLQQADIRRGRRFTVARAIAPDRWAADEAPGSRRPAEIAAVPAPPRAPSGPSVAAPPATAPPPAGSPRIALDPKSAEKGVARLVLTLVEFVRQLLERQAIRRMEGGLLEEDAVERMGETLARLEEKVAELKRAFGLEGESLDLDLGPLGRLNPPETGST